MTAKNARNQILKKLHQSKSDSESYPPAPSTPIRFANSSSFATNASNNGATIFHATNHAEAILQLKKLCEENEWLQPPIFAPSLEKKATELGLWPTLGKDPSIQGCVGASCAYCGIADTGTLILNSSAKNPTSLNFLPEHHAVFIEASRIVAKKQDVWKLMKQEEAITPRAINMISGPSRTADIEQTIQLGAHGPRSLTIFLIEQVNLAVKSL